MRRDLMKTGSTPTVARTVVDLWLWLASGTQMGNLESRAPESGHLDVDQALVLFQSRSSNATFNVFSLSSECHQCQPKVETTVSVEQNATIQLNVKFPVQLFVGEHLNRSDAVSCSNTRDFGQFGVYNCSIGYSQHALACECHQLQPSARIYLPIVVWFGALAALAVTFTLLRFVYRKIFAKCGKDLSADTDDQKTPPRKERLKSVDVFRGICITIMIFVNYLGGHYWFFEHSVWNGLLPADLVFPWFVWLMGLCVPMAMRSLGRRRVARRRIVTKIFKRTLLLFAIGFVLSNIGQYEVRRLRIMGVLQRIAIAYLGVALLCVTGIGTNPDCEPRPATDILLVLPQSLVALALVALHLVATFMLPVPGCPTGYLGPGGGHRAGLYGNCTGGATGYIDRLVLGEGHMYASPEIGAIYGPTLPFDPEGILGCLQTIFLAFLGVQAGVTMITFKKWTARVKRWLVWSVITGGVAAALCRVSKEDGWIPINKNLWSLSFVLATASLAFVALSVCYLLVDVTKVWSGEPFFYAGMNSILMYAGHMIAYNYFPWRWTISDGSLDVKTHEYGLVVSLWAATLWVFVSFLLYRANLFLKL